jgi:hypothetical protein
MAINEKYSYQSFKGNTFINVDPAEFNDTEIVGSSFYQQDRPRTKVFPDGTKNLELVRCNLDNVEVQPEITIKGGTNKQILAQKDGNFWIVDKSNKPIEPREKARYIELGLSVKPADLPATQLAEPITVTNNPEIIEQRAIAVKQQDETWIKQQLINDGTLTAESVGS